MSENRQQQLAELQWQQAFEEISGRVTAPDRVEQIMRRVAAHDPVNPASSAAMAPRTSRMLAAALLLLGVAVTVVAAVLERGRRAEVATTGGQPEPSHRVVAAAVVGETSALQDPPAGQDPKPKQDPKPSVGKPRASKPQAGKPEAEPESESGPKPGEKRPKGSDPADLAAVRSAEAMLAAEKKLAELVKTGKIGGIDQVLPFDQLDNWNYTDGLRGMPPRVRKLDGKRVLMLGFMLPIDEVEGMREFLLVSSLWSCCYGTPPDINGIVRCRMPIGKGVDYQFEPLKVVGTFDVEETIEDGYCIDIYQLHVDFIEVIR